MPPGLPAWLRVLRGSGLAPGSVVVARTVQSMSEGEGDAFPRHSVLRDPLPSGCRPQAQTTAWGIALRCNRCAKRIDLGLACTHPSRPHIDSAILASELKRLFSSVLSIAGQNRLPTGRKHLSPQRAPRPLRNAPSRSPAERTCPEIARSIRPSTRPARCSEFCNPRAGSVGRRRGLAPDGTLRSAGVDRRGGVEAAGISWKTGGHGPRIRSPPRARTGTCRHTSRAAGRRARKRFDAAVFLNLISDSR